MRHFVGHETFLWFVVFGYELKKLTSLGLIGEEAFLSCVHRRNIMKK
jgi:hypothetical protein